MRVFSKVGDHSGTGLPRRVEDRGSSPPLNNKGIIVPIIPRLHTICIGVHTGTACNMTP